MKKRILSLLLILCIVCSLLPGVALAADETFTYEVPDTNIVLTYTVNEDNTITITDCNEDGSGELEIPTMIDGKSITSIGESAFRMCDSLTSIIIPKSVTSIGEWAFYYCSRLAKMTIPESIISIGDNAFGNCSHLTSAGPIGSGYSIEFGWTDKIPANAFYDCSSLKSITIPDSVTSIGEYAFHRCNNLTSIIIPELVVSISDGAFSQCSALTSVNIPRSITSISDRVFSKCSSLTGINIPDSVTSIGANAFYDCSSLKSITIPDSVTSIGTYAFWNCSSLTSINIPGSVTSIKPRTFLNCINLTTVNISDSVTSIEEYAFLDCSSLTNVTIPDSVTSIGIGAFSDCSSLTNVTIPASVTSIGHHALGYDENTPVENFTINGYCRSAAEEYATQYNFIFNATHNVKVADTVEPTCTQPGMYPAGKCSVCGKIVTNETEIPALGHNFTGTYLTDETGHWHKCSRCDAVDTKAAHTYNTTNCAEAANCTVCGYTRSAGTHTWNAGEVITAPTCMTTGTMKYTCTSCGETKEEPISVSNHTPGNTWASDEAGHWHNCTVCNQKVDSTSHTFGSWTTTKAATSTAEGSRERVCNVCGYKQTETIPADRRIVLSYNNRNTTTTVNVGETIKLQRNLSDGMISKYTVKDSTGSTVASKSFDTIGADVVYLGSFEPATAGKYTIEYTITGYTVISYSSGGYYHKTTGEGAKYTLTLNVQKPTSPSVPDPEPVPDYIRNNVNKLVEDILNYGESITGSSGATYKVLKDTLTTSSSTMELNITYRNDINILVFNYDIETATARVHVGFNYDIDTCSSKNNNVNFIYTAKDIVLSFGCKAPFDISKYEEDTVLNFAINESVVGTPPTEAQYNKIANTGVQAATSCWDTLLQKKTSQSLRTIGFFMYGDNPCFDEATGIIKHTEVIDPAVTPTCTTAGKTEGKHCSVCNAVITAQTEIPALGHDFTGTYLTDETGHWHKCSRCDTVDTKAAHTYNTTNCGEAANCTVCGYTKAEGTHTWNAGEVITTPTCTTTGTMKYTCTSCGETKEEPISVSNHTPGNTWASDEAGHWHNCTVCNQKVDSASHTFGSWTTTKTATATTAGSRERVCNVCGYKQTESIPATGGGNIGGGGGGSVVAPPAKDETKNDEQTTNTTVYNDIPANAWYTDAVSFVTEKGLMSGTGTNTFAPGANLTRAMLAQILYNNEDKPTTSGNAFTDVQSGAWYANAITWATQKGIVSGYGNGQFGPDDSITREQLAVMLWRYAGQPTSNASLNSFTDIDKASDYALTALQWAVEKGIISGKGNGTLDPAGNATRAEVAQMLMNYFK